jgi:uncharacterized protein
VLLEFRVKNFKCFRDEQVLSLVAGSDDSLPENLTSDREKNKLRLLRSIVVYGANASGKTSLLEAFNFARYFVLSSVERVSNRQILVKPFLFDPESGSSPATFEFSFLQNSIRYQYGFVVNSERVLEEYLFYAPRGRTALYFERKWENGKDLYSFGDTYRGGREVPYNKTRGNALFLTTGAAFNNPVLQEVLKWFSKISVEMQSTLASLIYPLRINESYHQGIRDLLRFADLGIVDYRQKDTADALENSDGNDYEMLHQIQEDKIVALPLTSESEGTQHIFYLANVALPIIEQGGLLIVDELDASLHPLLVRALVEIFHHDEINRNNAQLIFNTHDITLLDPTLFRRDQVWFTEKNAEGAAHLYSLLEYSPRKGESLSKGYLQGRYGAIPYISDPAFLFQQENIG